MKQLLSDIDSASLGLAAVILIVAALLGYREWLDRLGRPAVLGVEDKTHFHRRDQRRSSGLSILCILALGVVVGSRTPVLVGTHANPWFLGIWLAIFGLLFLLLGLALVDWVELRRYAQRKKSAIGREHRSILQAHIERWKAEQSEEIPPGEPDR